MRKLAILLVLVSFLSAACAQATPEPVTFTIEMSEFAYSPSAFEVKIGQEVTFELVNAGTLEHEIMFGREIEMDHGRPSGYITDMFDHAGVEPPMVMMMSGEMGHTEEDDHGHAGFMVLLETTGDKASITFTVTEEMLGEWEIGCFLQEGVHYEQGMIGTFTVTQ